MVILFHHLTTAAGARKYRLLAAAVGPREVVGLDNGRGGFLTRRVDDLGFGARHEAEWMLAVARAAGGRPVAPAPVFPADAARFDGELPERYAVIFPATGPYSSARTWPAERYATVARGIVSQRRSLVVAGGSDARKAAGSIVAAVPEAIDLTGRTTLAQLAGVLARAEVVVGADSFIGHMAAALGRPVVSVFGPSNHMAWRPVSDAPAIVVRDDLPCSPCLYTGFSLGRPNGCPTRACLARVEPRQVLAGVERALTTAARAC
jgi:heptosyltransferase-2